MTELLQRVIAELEKLPEDEQNAIATRLLAELEDERAWKVRFESTTNEQWDRLAQMVRQEIVAGDITPLDEVFPLALTFHLTSIVGLRVEVSVSDESSC
jgi:mRNA-degrading endonuclease RelE of RelBE toxin-antitoxin system